MDGEAVPVSEQAAITHHAAATPTETRMKR
jgi:hypothetical protein